MYRVVTLLLVAMVCNLTAAFKSARGVGLGGRRMLSTLSMSSSTEGHKVGFMFPGQGAQYEGMGKNLCAEVPEAKKLFDKASTILGYDLLDVCSNGPTAKLSSTAVCQPAIFVSSMAALEKLKLQDPTAIERCTVAMGLSLGEYSALCFAGVFSFEDGVRLAKTRGEAMQAASDKANSGMLAVLGLSAADVEKLGRDAEHQSGKPVWVANYLVEGNYVLSGDKEALEAARQLAPAAGARLTSPLAVSGAFHTAFMEPAVPQLREALDKTVFHPPRIPVISNVDAAAHMDPAEIRDILVKQVTSPVRWDRTMTALLKNPQFEKAYEVGPGTVCQGIVRRYGKQYQVIGVPA